MRDLPTCADLPSDYRPAARTPGADLFRRPDPISSQERTGYPASTPVQPEAPVFSAPPAAVSQGETDAAADRSDMIGTPTSPAQEATAQAPASPTEEKASFSSSSAGDQSPAPAAVKSDTAPAASSEKAAGSSGRHAVTESGPAENALGRSVSGAPDAGTVHLVTPSSPAAWRTPRAPSDQIRPTAQERASERRTPRNDGCWQCS